MNNSFMYETCDFLDPEETLTAYRRRTTPPRKLTFRQRVQRWIAERK